MITPELYDTKYCYQFIVSNYNKMQETVKSMVEKGLSKSKGKIYA